MSVRNGPFRKIDSRSGRGNAAGAVIACAVMLLAGCGGSAADAGASDMPSPRGMGGEGGYTTSAPLTASPESEKCPPLAAPFTATAADGGVNRVVTYVAPTGASAWVAFKARSNGGEPIATVATSNSSGTITVRGLTKGAKNTFTVQGINALNCAYITTTN